MVLRGLEEPAQELLGERDVLAERPDAELLGTPIV